MVDIERTENLEKIIKAVKFLRVALYVKVGRSVFLFIPLIPYFKSYSLFGHSWVFSENFGPFLTFMGSFNHPK